MLFQNNGNICAMHTKPKDKKRELGLCFDCRPDRISRNTRGELPKAQERTDARKSEKLSVVL